MCNVTRPAGAKPLLVVFWSDEWGVYNNVKMRALYMRIMNDPEVKKHVVGTFREGTVSH